MPVRSKYPAARSTPRYPFRLNTGRIRDQWHTMTRSGLSPHFSAHMAEPFVELDPGDAKDLDVKPADLVQLTGPTGTAVLRARITDTVQRGLVFAHMHGTGETAPSAWIDALVAAACDPMSGQPESKASVVAARRYEAAWYGLAVSHRPMALTCDYWALARTTQGYRAELAGSETIMPNMAA